MTHLSHPPWFDHPNICHKVQVMKIFIMQFSPVPFFLLGPNILPMK
jgi:hypothetical protein